jgi:valyl-tRNA synthetase
MKPLAVPALRVVHKGLVRFHPDRWMKVYEHWMMNIRDWCISRQIWWGHRIPVYYAPDGQYTAARNDDEARKRMGLDPSVPVTQDENVLDTWFSSWLWPFSTLGWPKDNEDLRYFNPTDTLVTGPDIIFFWVARMVMANMEFMKGTPRPDGKTRRSDEDLVPFRNVYFTSIVRDARGRKLSKSLGNSPDPLDVIKEYGADGLRFTITYLAPIGQDVIFSTEKCEIGRNFANKVWNAGRFLLMNKADILGNVQVDLARLSQDHLDLADRWILSRLHHAIVRLNAALEDFKINEATKILYSFLWHDFCDWYVELVKTRLYGNEAEEIKRTVLGRALWIFDQALRLLHPIMPFVTEELWQHLADRNGEPLMRSEYPRPEERWIDDATEDEMDFVQDVINAIRNIRGENNVPPSKEIGTKIRFADSAQASILERYSEYLQQLARVTSIEVLKGSEHPRLSSSSVVRGAEVFVPLEGLIDIEAERLRLQKEIGRVRQLLEGISRKLSNAQFTHRAPSEVVEKEREKQAQFNTNLAKLERHLQELSW